MSVYGRADPSLLCPFCGVTGKVRKDVVVVRRPRIKKRRLVFAAVVTLGLTLLSPSMRPTRWRRVRQAHCDACDSTWKV
jgi:hypothetical protein